MTAGESKTEKRRLMRDLEGRRKYGRAVRSNIVNIRLSKGCHISTFEIAQASSKNVFLEQFYLVYVTGTSNIITKKAIRLTFRIPGRPQIVQQFRYHTSYTASLDATHSC